MLQRQRDRGREAAQQRVRGGSRVRHRLVHMVVVRQVRAFMREHGSALTGVEVAQQTGGDDDPTWPAP
jgi:hypothetical protein